MAGRFPASCRRGGYPPGFARHIEAIIACGGRVHLLREIKAPVPATHGRDDIVETVEVGIDTVELVDKRECVGKMRSVNEQMYHLNE